MVVYAEGLRVFLLSFIGISFCAVPKWGEDGVIHVEVGGFWLLMRVIVTEGWDPRGSAWECPLYAVSPASLYVVRKRRPERTMYFSRERRP